MTTTREAECNAGTSVARYATPRTLSLLRIPCRSAAPACEPPLSRSHHHPCAPPMNECEHASVQQCLDRSFGTVCVLYCDVWVYAVGIAISRDWYLARGDCDLRRRRRRRAAPEGSPVHPIACRMLTHVQLAVPLHDDYIPRLACVNAELATWGSASAWSPDGVSLLWGWSPQRRLSPISSRRFS